MSGRRSGETPACGSVREERFLQVGVFTVIGTCRIVQGPELGGCVYGT